MPDIEEIELAPEYYSSEGAPPMEADPIADQFTWETAQAPNTARWDDIVEGGPEIQMAPEAMRPIMESQAVRGSVSGSHTGMPGGPRAVDDMFSGAHQKANQAWAQFDPQYAEQEARTEAQYDEYGTGLAEEAMLVGEQSKREAQIRDRVADLHESHATVVQQIEADSKMVREELVGRLREQLAGIAALSAQDANPLHGSSTGQQIGLGGAAFAQGFLKAGYGIDIDVAGQVDRWVSRELEQHQMKIKNARDGANDTMHLYDLARQESQDEIEALTRYRVMVMHGAQHRIQAEAARFNSPLAMARAKQKIAALEIQKESAIGLIGERRQQGYLAYHKQFADEAAEAGRLKIQKDAQSLGWYNARTNRMEAETKKKATESEGSGLVPVKDIGDVMRDKSGKVISGGKSKWLVDPKNPHLYKSVLAQQKAYSTLHDGIDRLRVLRGKFDGVYGPQWIKNRSSKEYREYRAERDRITGDIRKQMTGLAGTDAELKMWADQLPDDKLLEDGDNASMADNLQEWGRKQYERVMNDMPGMVKIPKHLQEYEQDPNVADPAAKAGYDARLGDAPIAGPVSKDLGRFAAKGNKVEHGGFSPGYADYLQRNPGVVVKNDKTYDANAGQPREIDAIDSLALHAIDPSRGVTESQGSASAEEIQNSAYGALNSIANGEKIGARAPSDAASNYAKEVLANIERLGPKAAELYDRRVTSAPGLETRRKAGVAQEALNDPSVMAREAVKTTMGIADELDILPGF